MALPEHYLGRLREQVRIQSGISQIYHNNCESLSRLIFEKTGRKLSTSTLKRFFRLVHSNSSYSRYTLDTLSRYTGYEHFDDFTRFAGTGMITDIDFPRSEKQAGLLVTDIKKLQKEAIRSAAEFHIGDAFRSSFLRRTPMLHDLYSFYRNTTKRIYPLIAPGGYGKTVLMQQFFYDLLEDHDKNRLIFFTSAANIADKVIFQTGIYAVLKQLAPSFETNSTLAYQLLHREDFYILLMIDGVDESGNNQSEVSAFYKGLHQLIRQVLTYPNIDILFSQRTESWSNCFKFHPEFRIDQNWYLQPGIDRSEEHIETVPPLSINEIRSLWHRLNRVSEAQATHDIDDEVLALISVPYQLKLLHRIARQNRMRAVTNQDAYGVYIQHLMFDKPMSIGIRSIFMEMVRLTDYGTLSHLVSLDRLQPVISRHQEAWDELLGREVLSITGTSGDNLFRKPRVGFTHQKLFESVIAVYWYGDGTRSCRELRELIEKLFNKTILAGVLEQLAWAIMRDHRLDLLIELFESNLDKLDKEMLSKSIFGLWQDEEHWLEKNIDGLAANPSFRKYYFQTLVLTDDLPGFFGRAMHVYDSYSESAQDKLFGKCILTVKAFLEMDFSGMVRYMDEAHKIRISDDIHLFPLTRYWSYRSLCEWLGGDDPADSLAKVDELIRTNRHEYRYTTKQEHHDQTPGFRFPLYLHTPTLWMMKRKEDIAGFYNLLNDNEKAELVEQAKLDNRMFTLLYFLFYSGVIPEPFLKTSEEHRLLITNKNISERHINHCLRLMIMSEWYMKKDRIDNAIRVLHEVRNIAHYKHFRIFEKLAEYHLALLEENDLMLDTLKEEFSRSGFGKIIAPCSLLPESALPKRTDFDSELL